VGCSPPIYTSCHNWDDKCLPPCPSFFYWDGVLATFCPGWPGTTSLMISASCIAGITSACCYTQLLVEMGYHELFAWG
jgi:hypothetical protein